MLPRRRRPRQIAPLGLETVPLSRHEIDYPFMRECTRRPAGIVAGGRERGEAALP